MFDCPEEAIKTLWNGCRLEIGFTLAFSSNPRTKTRCRSREIFAWKRPGFRFQNGNFFSPQPGCREKYPSGLARNFLVVMRRTGCVTRFCNNENDTSAGIAKRNLGLVCYQGWNSSLHIYVVYVVRLFQDRYLFEHLLKVEQGIRMCNDFLFAT